MNFNKEAFLISLKLMFFITYLIWMFGSQPKKTNKKHQADKRLELLDFPDNVEYQQHYEADQDGGDHNPKQIS